MRTGVSAVSAVSGISGAASAALPDIAAIPAIPDTPVPRRRRAGFTLLELIVASTVTVMVTAAAAVMIRSIAAARERVDRQAQLQQQTRAAVDAVATALRNAYRPTHTELILLEGIDDTLAGTTGGADFPSDRIRFFTVSQRTIRPGEPESDVREVEFFVQPGEAGDPPTLMRRTDPTRNEEPDGGGVIEPVAQGIVAFDLAYHDGLMWRDNWDEAEHAWPRAVRVRVMAAAGDPDRPALWTASRLVNFPYAPIPPAEQATEEATP